MITAEVLLMMVLALTARFMVPKMMYTESAKVRFAVGCALFVMYNVVCLAMCRYLCCYSYMGGRGVAISDLSGPEVWNRVVVAFLLTNAAVLFAACIFYFTRDKRTLSQKEKMKLKDL